MSSVASVAAALHKWRMDEMKYASPDGVTASEDNLKELCCGALLDVWSYIAANVFSSDTIHTVRGNIELYAQDLEPSSEDDVCDVESVDQLEKSIQLVDAEIETVSADLSRLQTELADKYESSAELTEATRRCQRVSNCYRLCTEQLVRRTDSCTLATSRLAALLNTDHHHHHQQSCDNCDAPDNSDTPASDCQSQVDASLSLIVSHVSASGQVLVSRDAREKASALVRRCVTTCADWQLLACFESLQKKALLSLQQLTAQKDKETSETEAALVSCTQRVVDSLRATHMQWALEALAARNQHSKLMRQLDQQLQQQQADPSSVELAKANLLRQSSEYSLQLFKKACQSLPSEDSDALEEAAPDPAEENKTDALEALLSSIDTMFTEAGQLQLQNRCQLVPQLRRCVEALRVSLTRQTEQLPLAVQTVCTHVLNDVRRVRVGGGGAGGAGGGGADDGSAQLVPARQLAVQLSAHGVNSYLARTLAIRQQQLAVSNARTRRLLRRLRIRTDFSAQLEDVSSRVSAALQREIDHQLPCVQKSGAKHKRVVDAISSARNSLQIWRDEPAQAAADDIVYDDIKFDQWRERYRAARATLPPTHP